MVWVLVLETTVLEALGSVLSVGATGETDGDRRWLSRRVNQTSEEEELLFFLVPPLSR